MANLPYRFQIDANPTTSKFEQGQLFAVSQITNPVTGEVTNGPLIEIPISAETHSALIKALNTAFSPTKVEDAITGLRTAHEAAKAARITPTETTP